MLCFWVLGWHSQKRQQAADTRETVLSGLKLTGETLGQGIAEFLGNRQEMTAVVLGLSAAALGIYSAKMGTGIMGRYVEVRTWGGETVDGGDGPRVEKIVAGICRILRYVNIGRSAAVRVFSVDCRSVLRNVNDRGGRERLRNVLSLCGSIDSGTIYCVSVVRPFC